MKRLNATETETKLENEKLARVSAEIFVPCLDCKICCNVGNFSRRASCFDKLYGISLDMTDFFPSKTIPEI